MRESAIAFALVFTPWLSWAQVSDSASAPVAAPPAGITAAASAAPVAAPAISLAASAPATAKPTPIPRTTSSPLLPAPAWKSLNPAQQAALQPLERDWNTIDDFGRSKWLEIAARYPALPAVEQARLQERMHSWARMSPAERQQARLSFQDAQQLKPDARQAKWEAYQALTPEQRQALTEKAVSKQIKRNAAPGQPVAGAQQQQAKSNLIPSTSKGLPNRSVAPAVVQAKSGASTVLINQRLSQPSHQQAGQTKVFADPSLVDSKTLLPKRTPPPQQ
ncbi:DUF3106 domain-containing protein [Roseateles sp. PN1]|uniref:DUF3106 domain-containing protein n=1 Tax=Roseateles sp. PN1 TaxID=3137372 RepID=UPI0031389E98